MTAELPELLVADAAALRAWLAEHQDDPTGVWLVLAKGRGPGPTGLTYPQAVEEALCHGWIDGQSRRRDDTTYLVRYTPRRPRSPWSARNVGIVERLVEQGRMRPRGLAEVERARADGRWDAAYAGPATVQVPDDLAAAVAALPRAQAMFDILTSQNRFAIVHRVNEAKRPETRRRRVDQYVEMLARGETIYPQKRRLED